MLGSSSLAGDARTCGSDLRPKSFLYRRQDDEMLKIITGVALLVIAGIALYLWIQNRSLPELNAKVVPVVFLGCIGATFTIWYSLRSERIDHDFTSTVYFHKSTLLPLDEHDSRRYLIGGDQFDISLKSLAKNRVECDPRFRVEDSNRRVDEAAGLYFDMVFLKLIDRFFWAYGDWWDVRITSARHGNNVMSVASAIKPGAECASLSWEDFRKASDGKDPFLASLSGYPKEHQSAKMTVPPKTKLSIAAIRGRRSLVLTNPFVEVSITLSYTGGSIGIGDYAWLLGYDNKKSEEFWSEFMDVECSADFKRTRSGHPDMARYRRWVETMFAEIRYQLSDEDRMKRARDYHDLVSPRNR